MYSYQNIQASSSLTNLQLIVRNAISTKTSLELHLILTIINSFYEVRLIFIQHSNEPGDYMYLTAYSMPCDTDVVCYGI